MKQPVRKRILIPALLLAGAAVLAVLWRWIDTIPLGIAVAVVLEPLQYRLSSRIPRLLSALAVTLILLAAGIAGTFFVLTVMQENLATNEEILMKAAGGVEILASQFEGLGIPREAIAGAMQAIRGMVEAVGSFWSGITILSALMNGRVLLFLGSLFLSLWEGDRALRWILLRVPAGWMEAYRRLTAVSVDALHSVLVVHLLIVAFTFAISLPFFWLLGYGHVLYLSTATALCELVPVLGASIPMVILLLYSFDVGDLRGFLLVFFAGYLVVALLPEVTIRPILMGRRTHLSPFVMFLGFMGGILLLGISGFLLGPLALAVAASWWRFRRERKAEVPPGIQEGR